MHARLVVVGAGLRGRGDGAHGLGTAARWRATRRARHPGLAAGWAQHVPAPSSRMAPPSRATPATCLIVRDDVGVLQRGQQAHLLHHLAAAAAAGAAGDGSGRHGQAGRPAVWAGRHAAAAPALACTLRACRLPRLQESWLLQAAAGWPGRLASGARPATCSTLGGRRRRRRRTATLSMELSALSSVTFKA